MDGVYARKGEDYIKYKTALNTATSEILRLRIYEPKIVSDIKHDKSFHVRRK